MLTVDIRIVLVLCCCFLALAKETVAAPCDSTSSNPNSAFAEHGIMQVTALLLRTNTGSPRVRTIDGAALVRTKAKPSFCIQTTTTTVTKRVQNADQTYTVIEYPAKKEVQIYLNPVSVRGAKGMASILRDDEGTRINLNLSNLPADLSALTLYAVDEKGTITALGPIPIHNGIGTLTTTTPLTKFMLIVAADSSLTTYDPNTTIVFRSAVPEGFAVIPLTSNYIAPLLNIPSYKAGDDTKTRLDFLGAMAGARGNVFITPHKDGPTEVRIRLRELKEAPAGKKYVVWAVSPNNEYVKLGQIIIAPGRNEAELKSEIAFPNFGLLVTMESSDGATPVGPAVVTISIVP